MKTDELTNTVEEYKKDQHVASNHHDNDFLGDPRYEETPEHINETRKGDCYCEQEMDEYRRRHPLEQAIRCWKWGEKSRKHRHQWRVDNKSIDALTETALKRIAEIRRCKTFHDLFLLTQAIKPSGIGSLSTYDFALRVGMSLGLEPMYIYLHAGARIGAENLLGEDKVNNRGYLCLEEIPEPLRYMEPYHIENFFCIHKDKKWA